MKLNKLLQLKEPKDYQTYLETENISEILSYVRMCVQFGVQENVNEVFVTIVAKKLREDSGKKLLSTKGLISISAFIYSSFII